MHNTKSALIWITDILKNQQIPFQITGGLAAHAYGATRPIIDIDIDIPDDQFQRIIPAVKPHIIFGPERYKDDQWDMLLMTLKYQDQDIDLSGADSTHIFHAQTQQWIKLKEDLSQPLHRKIFGVNLPTIPINKLIDYKNLLARAVDKIDIEQLNVYVV